MGQNEPFWVPKMGVVTGNFWSLSGGVVETYFLRRADFLVGHMRQDQNNQVLAIFCPISNAHKVPIKKL